MPEQLWVTAILNRLFAAPVTALLRAIHIEPRHPQAPIPNTFAMEVLVFLFLLVLFLMLRSRLSVERPGALQHIFEGAEGFIHQQSQEIIGHHSEGYTPFLATLGFFILFCNLIGLIPGFESPTMNPAVPLGCAMLVFVYYNFMGFWQQGVFRYLAHFAGPIWWLSWLMIPIEIISHLSRPMSLTIRLFANMLAGDQVTLAILGLTYLVAPVAFMGLHIFVSFLQAYIFVLLTMMYLSETVPHEQH